MNATTQPARHTPGPWTIDESGIIRGSDGDPVGLPVSRRSVLQDATRIIADRHILGAALDAIEALRHVIRWHDQLSHQDLARIRAIIDQSEGRLG